MSNAAQIAALNDAFRANPSLGTFVLTACILTDMPQDVAAILDKVRTFKDFNEGDDPYGERDFGAFDFKGKRFSGRLITMTAILNLPRRMLLIRRLPIAF